VTSLSSRKDALMSRAISDQAASGAASKHNALFGPLPVWMRISGMSRSGTYRAIARKDLHAVKLGRSLLIDIEHGMTWLRSLPPANIRPSQ
jgi:hypothetical protein